MHTINIPTMKLMVKHVAVEQREPLMFWGQPGCGKSEGIAQACADMGGMLVDVRLSQYDSVDLRGIPVPNESGLTTWHPPATLPFEGNPAFPQDKLIFLFLDELNSAAPSVQAVAYQLINDRQVGEHVLMENVVVIAAGNREGDRGVTNRMPTPLANRFTHAEIGIDVDAWCHWATQSGLPAEGVAFMQFRKNLLSTFDPAKPDKAFATPRTWSKALRYYASKMPTDVKQAAMTGAVGEGPSAEFWGFIDVWAKMPPMEKIIKDPEGIKLPEEAAMRYAVTVAVSGTMDKKTTAPLSKYLARLDPEFSILAWQLAITRDIELTTLPEFIDFSKRHREVLQR